VILGIAVAMQISSVLLAVAALRTLNLSQLIPFAACAYVIVPVSSRLVFKENLHSTFWIGAILIVIGVTYTQL
jgi:undecaprenyl phosphate-alpha-L-ara4N flippase subunit ArnE